MSAADPFSAAIAAAVGAAIQPLRDELAELRQALAQQPSEAGDPDQQMSPGEVRKLARCRLETVYGALERRELAGQAREGGRGGRRCWSIRRADAIAWIRRRATT